MSGLALAVAIVAPIISGSSGTGPTMPPVELPVVEMHPIPPARTPAPGPERVVQIPDGLDLTIELAASTVTPKPPPPPPKPSPRVSQVAYPAPDHSAAIARAKSASNGQLPADSLCGWGGVLVRCDMAAALEAAAVAGMPRVQITSGYRSFQDQVDVKASRGSWAATPGQSNHGFGTAVDIPEPARSWLFQNGGAHGLINPQWAKDPNRTERWHWELAS